MRPSASPWRPRPLRITHEWTLDRGHEVLDLLVPMRGETFRGEVEFEVKGEAKTVEGEVVVLTEDEMCRAEADAVDEWRRGE